MNLLCLDNRTIKGTFSRRSSFESYRLYQRDPILGMFRHHVPEVCSWFEVKNPEFHRQGLPVTIAEELAECSFDGGRKYQNSRIRVCLARPPVQLG